MHGSLWILLVSTASVAFFHALAPDHWMPFAAMGKAQKWSNQKLLGVTLIAGLGHVGISVLVSMIGIILGFSLTRFKGIEGHRGEIVLWLLIGFGIAYMLWGIKNGKEHRHSHIDSRKLRTKKMAAWTLFTIFILGPCEPLVPLIFLGYTYGYVGIMSVCAVFSVITLAMMLSQSFLAFKGIQLIKHDIAERYSHAFAGLVIVLTGIFVMALGI